MRNRPINRREFLAGGAGMAAALAFGGSGSRLLSYRGAVPLKSTLERPVLDVDYSAIKHVVFLMHENRSFDHYYGVLQGVNGFFDSGGDAFGTDIPNYEAFYQGWTNGTDPTLQPFHLDTTTGIAECTNDLSHSWQAEHSSWNSGAMDSFVSTHTSSDYEGPELGTLTMGYYNNNDIPYYYALAQAFTICDNYFCSVLGPTHPNRLMQMTGTIDPAGVAGGPILVTNSSNDLTGTCSWTTMPEILQDAGVSWKVYNPAGSNYIPNGTGLSMDLCKNPLFYMSQHTGAPTNSPLYQNAFSNTGISIPTSSKVFSGLSTTGAPSNFVSDVQSNTLPQVSWIIPPDGYDEHPPAPAALGEWYTSQVIATLQSNTEVWQSTVLFIMYDENDGWFDHVIPPTPLAGTAGEYVTASGAPSWATGPIGLGVRVPMLVVSPFSQGGWVCSDVFDHTSQLQFVAAVLNSQGYDIDGTVGGNVSAWRQGTVGDLTSTLANFPNGSATPPPSLPSTSDNDTAVPVDDPDQCTGNDLLELGGPTTVAVDKCSVKNHSKTVKGPWPSSLLGAGLSGVVVGMSVSGTGIPNGTVVTAVKEKGKTKTGTVTLSNEATTTHKTTLTFVQPVPVYPIPSEQPVPTEVSSSLVPTPS